MRFLIVEDELGLADGLKALLEKSGYSVDAVYDGISGLDCALSGIYDLVILDILLPKMDGLKVVQAIREEGLSVPVIMLTARSEIADRIQGLDHGADDYLTKPFDMGELLARLRALTRRRGELVDTEILYGDLRLNQPTQELRRGTSSVKLGQKEYQLMEILMSNKNQIVSKDMLCEKVWGIDGLAEYNNVEVYLSFLRKKLHHLHSAVQIKATRNVGYSLEEGCT